MKYQIIVFDWDGTLYDSGAYTVNCFQQAARDTGIEAPEGYQIRDLMGLSLEEVLHRLMPKVLTEKREEFTKAYRALMEKCDFNRPFLFAGAEAVLKQLKDEGYSLAIATGKCRRGLDFDLKELDIGHFFAVTRCADETRSKPHPQMLLEIVDELMVERDRVLMVGDTEYDIQLAVNAKVDALAVNYGMHDEQRLLKNSVKGCLSDISELPEWLMRI